MSVPDVIEALAAHWDDVAGHLSDDQLAAISAAVHAVPPDQPGPPDQRDHVRGAAVRVAAHRVADVLMAALPRRHPVLRALTDGVRFRGDAAGTARDDLPGLLVRVAIAADATSVERAADARLSRTATIGLDGVRSADLGVAVRDLILLEPDRTPSFQFDGTGRPIPVVIEINHLLDAAGDPWGVADWWLGENAWLGGVPAELLGAVDGETLVMAARAELVVD